jgi:hypothetical protein
MGGGNIMTLQCLCLKALYLYNIEKADPAYDVLGKAVRMVFQLGLHNQQLWNHYSPYDIETRRRLLWGVFVLEHLISFHAGAPPLLREDDVNVQFPGDYDDRIMFPDQPLPEPTPDRSFGPFVRCLIKWSHLSSDIRRNVFSPGACSMPACDEFEAITDTRIVHAMKTIPKHLQWGIVRHELNESTVLPSWVKTQSFTLHMVRVSRYLAKTVYGNC